MLAVPDDGKTDDEVVAVVELSLSCNKRVLHFFPEGFAEVCMLWHIPSGVWFLNPVNPEVVEIWELEGGTDADRYSVVGF